MKTIIYNGSYTILDIALYMTLNKMSNRISFQYGYNYLHYFALCVIIKLNFTKPF